MRTILLISVDALPRVGGISLMMHHVANSLVSLGYRAICLGPKGSFVPRDFPRHYELIEDWESETSKRSGPDGLFEDERIKRLLTRVVSEEEINRIVLMHPFYYGIGALDAAAATGVPVSAFFHGFELRSQLQGRYPANQAKLIRDRAITTLRDRTFYLVSLADEVLVNSRYTASLFDGFQLKPPVKVTGCGVPQEIFSRERSIFPKYDPREKQERRIELGLNKAPCLTFVGRLVPTKGVDEVIRIVATSNELSGLIIGTGPDEERLKKLCRKLALGDRVQFLGAVSEDEKWEYLRASNFLCLLSRPDDFKGQVEGFGIALVEGACAACVPVTSGTGGMRDVVSNWKTGLIVSSDPEQAAEDLVVVAARPELAASLVSAARKQIENSYNWTRVAQRMTEGWC